MHPSQAPLPSASLPWPAPPPPPGQRSLPTLLVVLVIIVVIGIAFAAIVALLVLPLVMQPPILTPPNVALGLPSVSANATIGVTSVSSNSPIDLFEVNLGIGAAVGSPQSIERSPAYTVVVVSSQRYRISWTSVGSSMFLGIGDRFTIGGDGAPLPLETSFTFYLVWRISGNVLAFMDWTTGAAYGKPAVTFAAVDQSSGNATIGVAGASQSVSPSNYKVNLQVGTNTGLAVAMPTTGGLFASLTISGTTYRIYWTDIGGEKTVNSGDNFRVTGNNVALPAATSFTFYLLWSDGSSIQSKTWSTP